MFITESRTQIGAEQAMQLALHLSSAGTGSNFDWNTVFISPSTRRMTACYLYTCNAQIIIH